MGIPALKPSVRWLDALPVVLALWIAGRVLLAFAGRFDHPFDLEWMEGGMLAHAWRLQQGLGVYVAPSPDFVPYIYPPGYPTLLAGLGALFGLEYPLGRLLSIGGTLAAAAAIPFVTGRQFGRWVVGLAGAALYLGLFRASGGFYDLVRPDALGMACLAWSVALATERWRGAEIVSGLLLCAAFLFKHNFALFGVPLLAGLWLRDSWPLAVRFVAASAGPALLATLYVQVVSSGHFLTYLLEVPRSHPMMWARFWHAQPGELGVWLMPAVVAVSGWLLTRSHAGRRPWEWAFVLLPAILGARALWIRTPIRGIDMGEPWVATVAGAALLAGLGAATGAVLRAAATRSWAPSWRVVMAVGVGAVALLLAGLMRAHHGGFINVLMPAHWVLVIGLCMVAEDARRRMGTVGVVGSALVLVAQLGWVGYRLDAQAVIPDEDQVAAGRAVEQRLAEACADGLIWAPQFAWLPTRVGRPPSMPLISLWDVADHPRGPYRAQATQMMRDALSSHHWTCVLQGAGRHSAWKGLTEQYQVQERLRAPANQLHPMTGWRVRPAEILVPRSDP